MLIYPIQNSIIFRQAGAFGQCRGQVKRFQLEQSLLSLLILFNYLCRAVGFFDKVSQVQFYLYLCDHMLYFFVYELTIYIASVLMGIGLDIYYCTALNSDSYYLCFSLFQGLLILFLGYRIYISVCSRKKTFFYYTFQPSFFWGYLLTTIFSKEMKTMLFVKNSNNRLISNPFD